MALCDGKWRVCKRPNGNVVLVLPKRGYHSSCMHSYISRVAPLLTHLHCCCQWHSRGGQNVRLCRLCPSPRLQSHFILLHQECWMHHIAYQLGCGADIHRGRTMRNVICSYVSILDGLCKFNTVCGSFQRHPAPPRSDSLLIFTVNNRQSNLHALNRTVFLNEIIVEKWASGLIKRLIKTIVFCGSRWALVSILRCPFWH